MGNSKEWDIQPLKTVCSEIVDCINKTAPVVDYETEYKMIRTSNIKNGRVLLEGLRCVDEETFQKWTRRSRIKRNDVILTREAPLGEIGIVRSDEKLFLGQRTVVYRADEKNLNQIFMYYSFIGDTLQAQIRMLGSGSTVEHMRVPDAENLKIILPPYSTQRKIAAILSTYDELIENNNRRIAILEKMAEELYREWFVRLRFPGHEQVKVVKGVPEGWSTSSVKEISELVKRGVSPIYADASQLIVLNQKCIRNHKVDFKQSRNHNTRFSKEKNIRLWDVLINSTGVGTLGRAAIYCIETENVTVDSHITIARANQEKIDPIYYGYSLISYESYFENISSGSTGQTELGKEIIEKCPILIPPANIQDDFSKVTRNILKQTIFLQKQNESMKETRDYILPRLISGKLDVEALNITFPKDFD